MPPREVWKLTAEDVDAFIAEAERDAGRSGDFDLGLNLDD